MTKKNSIPFVSFKETEAWVTVNIQTLKFYCDNAGYM